MIHRFLVVLGSGVMLGFLAVASAGAAMLPSDTYLEAGQRVESPAIASIAMQRQSVVEQLEALGIDPLLARERVARLPDSDIAELSKQMEDMPAGGSVLGLIGAVVVVLFVLDIAGVVDVFGGI